MLNIGLCVMRPDRTKNESTSAKPPFMMLPHADGQANRERFEKLSAALINQENDGLSNIKQLCKIVHIKQYKLFTHILISI
jgi:hypothetical protein